MTTQQAKHILDDHAAFTLESGDAANEIDDFLSEYDDDFEGVSSAELIQEFNQFFQSFHCE